MVFEVYIGNANRPLREANANITLPAAPYQLLDVMERLRIEKPEDEYIQIEDYYDCEFLSSYLYGKASLMQLNTLAQKLSELEERQKDALEGLLRMDVLREKRPITIDRVIDLAHSTDSCQVVYEAVNDAQLGRFYAENGFIPEVEKVPAEAFHLLDFEKLGCRMSTEEGGVFTQAGYVVQTDDPVEVAKTMDFQLKEPDYAVLLEVYKKVFNVPISANDKMLRIKLPAAPEEIEAIPRFLEAASWEEVEFYALDCAVPQAMDWIYQTADFDEVESFASDLKLLQEAGSLTKYKAVLKATQCEDLQTAARLVETLDAYIYSPKLVTPEKVAEDELRNYLGDDANLLLPHVNLRAYGGAIIEHDGCALTEYGLIDRSDGLPVLENVGKPVQEGVEMTI